MWWNELWKTKAQDWIFAPLNPVQVPAGTAQGVVAPESAYLSIFLKSARVTHVRRGLTQFYGTVHSFISLQHRSQGEAQFNVVTTPAALKNVDAGGIDRIVQINQRLLGPLPYVGGDLKMEVGLFSVASVSLAEPYLALLEKLSQQAGVSFVNAALPFASVIVEGMKMLTIGAGTEPLEIGFSITQAQPSLGYFVNIRAPKETLDFSKLTVDPTDFRLLLDGRPFADYPYMVIEICSQPQRDDWSNIPEVARAYRDIQDNYRLRGNHEDTREALTAFRRITLTCNDLLFDDAERLARRVETKYWTDFAVPPRVRGAGEGPELPDLNKLVKLYG